MTPLEEQVWAAAFANEFAKTRHFYDEHGGGKWSIDDISGFSCGEVANSAVEKLRDALACEDREYLLPIAEPVTPSTEE